MGRTLKRVPLDFDWQLKKVWKGYVNPFKEEKCKKCDGDGTNEEYNKLNDRWYNYDTENVYVQNPFREDARYDKNAWCNNLTQEDVDALVENNRLLDFTRVPLNDEQKSIVEEKIKNGEDSLLPFDNGYRPTAKEVNEWNLKGMGHGAINRHCVIAAKLKREGKDWECEKCNGTGVFWLSEEAKYLYENWEQYEPPVGDGFQLWETTSEGSPSSPVFKTLDELCEWCEKNAFTFADYTATKEEWKKMLLDDNVHHKQGNITFI